MDSLAAQFPNRTKWWIDKLERNMRRDEEVKAHLTAEGWVVLRFWESDVIADAKEVVDRIVDAIETRGAVNCER